MLGWFVNQSKMQFDRFKSNPGRARPEFVPFLSEYSSSRDDYKIAANCLLTMLRSGALSLNIKPELGHKVIEHNSKAIRRLKVQITDESIVDIDHWVVLGPA